MIKFFFVFLDTDFALLSVYELAKQVLHLLITHWKPCNIMPDPDNNLSAEQTLPYSILNIRGIMHFLGGPGTGKTRTVSTLCQSFRKGLYVCPSYQSLHNSMDALIKEGYMPNDKIETTRGIFYLWHPKNEQTIELMTI